MVPEIRYAKSGDVHIAYQVFGNGPVDLVIIPGFISNIEHYWDWPEAARWLNHLAGRARVIMFDKRGTGLSDRLAACRTHEIDGQILKQMESTSAFSATNFFLAGNLDSFVSPFG